MPTTVTPDHVVPFNSKNIKGNVGDKTKATYYFFSLKCLPITLA